MDGFPHNQPASRDDPTHQSSHGWGQWPQPHVPRHLRRARLNPDKLQTRSHPFCRVVSGKQSVPLGRVTLPVTFEDTSNYQTETLTFEVVDFAGPYHVILG
jgi:hypothetical protein